MSNSPYIPLIVALALALSFLAGLVIASLRHEWQNMRKRIAELEQASNKRHVPYAVAEEIEDATAAILLAVSEIEFKKSVLDNALEHLHNARNNRRAGT